MHCIYYLDVSPHDIFLGIREAIPVCGEDFCDACDVCMSCQGGDPCYAPRDDHHWVRYVSQVEWDALGEP